MTAALKRTRTLALLLFVSAIALGVPLVSCAGVLLAAQVDAAPPPSVLGGWLAQGQVWAAEHPLEVLGLALYLLINAANRLARYPRAAGVRAVLLVLIDWLSFIPHRDSPGLFTVPLLGRSTPPPDAEHMGLTDALSSEQRP